MTFEVGKCYKHPSGEQIKIVADANTTLYGDCFIAESNKNHDLLPMGKEESFTVNWSEITEEQWMENFSK